MDVTELYTTIASGDSPELSNDDLRWVRKPLYEKALREVDASEPAGRLAALHVAAWLGLDRAIAVPAKLVRDADRSVRVSAFNLAVAAGDSGRALLRDVLLGSDAQLSAAALALLGRLQDQGALQSARRHVTHHDPAVQVAAIHLVGLVGGASVRPALGDRPGDADVVADAKAQARAWLDGDAPRPAPTPWWEGEDGRVDTTGTLVGPAVEPLFVATGSTAPPAPSPARPPEAEPEPTALVPSSPTDVAATTAPPADPTALPDPLPDEPRALAKLYGMVDASAQEALLPHLAALDASALAALYTGYRRVDQLDAVGRCDPSGPTARAADLMFAGSEPFMADFF